MTSDEFRNAHGVDRPEDTSLPHATVGLPAVGMAASSFGMAGFLPGTMIATEHGEIPIERIHAGMRVVALGGDLIAVAWTGHRHLVPSLHPRPDSVHPIRILRDAIADSIPPHDLIVGPGQPLFLSGTPIPARFLRNDSSVTIESAWAGVDYFHLALAGPGRPLAELVPVEPCDSAADKRAFGRDGIIKLHPGLVVSNRGPSILAEAIQQLLKRRAMLRGLVPSPEPDLRPPAPFSAG